MGVKDLTAVIRKHAPSAIQEIQPSALKGKVIAVDAAIVLNQFIHKCDGDSKRLVIGLFQRTANLIGKGFQLVYVFEGKPPASKQAELNRRNERQSHSERPRLSSKQVDECKALLGLMGVPYIDAPGEAESQCVELVKKGKCHAVASEDLDVLPLGGEVLIRSLKFSNDHPTATKIVLSQVLLQMNLTHDSFVDLCILLGCDYANKIPNIGKAKAVEKIQHYKTIENILSTLDYREHPVSKNWMHDVEDARRTFKHPVVHDANSIKLRWNLPQKEKLLDLLCEQCGDSESAVRKKLDLLEGQNVYK